ncbi:MAG: putative sugar nucleotidyl transferase [Bacteroidia bacterium]|nr:putative sugar nucleotidyl transferase [Bacteroidia bacterium]
MAYILFEDTSHFDLLPFTFTRPVFEIRKGIFTQTERWNRITGNPCLRVSYDYLGIRFNDPLPTGEVIWINGKFLPIAELRHLVNEAAPETFYLNPEKEVLIARFSPTLLPADHHGIIDVVLLEKLGLKAEKTAVSPPAIRHLPDIFQENDKWIAFDFELITRTETSGKIDDPHTRIYGADNIFVSPGVKVRAAIINAEDGPIFLGKNVEINEGAIIRRTHAICDYAHVNMGAKLRGDTTIGPHCKVGGEIANSVLMGYSNKGHEGYLGNAVIGYWCNLGADTNSSNLKNNYADVKLWHYPTEKFRDTGLQFCGLMMADHSKCGINTMFNTGTVVGVFANLFGSGFLRSYIPDFSWGGAEEMTTYRLEKAFEVAEKVMLRKGINFDIEEQTILSKVFEITKKYRNQEFRLPNPDWKTHH